jgi:hypothetical protein
MIIGVSGKIGSGKDTVGKIIQYLAAESNHIAKGHISDYKDCSYTIQEFLQGKDIYNEVFTKNYTESISEDSGWQIKKFAAKLKQIVSILTGISVEDLEKQEVKDRVLGNEWSRIVTTLHLSSDVNQIIKDIYTNAFFEQTNTSFIVYQRMTVRQLLQEIGTDAMRNVIHSNIWVNALFSDYKRIRGIERILKSTRSEEEQEIDGFKYPNWIITDVRFPNELKAIEDKDGITIRINRDLYHIGGGNYISKNEFINTPSVINNKNYSIEELLKANKKINNNEHPSETALDNAQFNYTIDNNGTIEELIEKVREILIKEILI